MSDLITSIENDILKNASFLRTVRRDLKSQSNFETSLEQSIISAYEIYKIEPHAIKGVSLEEHTVNKKVPLKAILDVFPNEDIRFILNNIVGTIEIDFEKTEENLKYEAEVQDVLVKKIIKQLQTLCEKKETRVVLK